MKKSNAKIRVAELAKRITGFSTPWFGVQWNPSKNERDIVRHFLTFLEDRRVLYTPWNLEVEGEVERSVIEIRRQCTETIAQFPDGAPSISPIRIIRGACRRFLDESRPDFRNLYPRDYGSFRDRAGFFTALGEFRATVGAQIAILAVYYEIDLEEQLASIVPCEDIDHKS